MALSQSKISSLVAELNSRVVTDAKRAASALDALLYPNYGPGPRVVTAAESQRIEEEHFSTIRGSDVIKPLLKVMGSGTEFARGYAAIVLGVIKDYRALPLLVDALAAASPVVRLAATKGLWFFRDPSTVPALIHSLQDSSQEVRCSAASALGFIGYAEAVPALIAFYECGDPKAKVAALDALGYIRDPQSLPLVRAALFDKDRKIRNAAKSALANYDSERRARSESDSTARPKSASSILLQD